MALYLMNLRAASCSSNSTMMGTIGEKIHDNSAHSLSSSVRSSAGCVDFRSGVESRDMREDGGAGDGQGLRRGLGEAASKELLIGDEGVARSMRTRR